MAEETRFDKATYEAAKKYLKPAMEQMLAAGRNVRDFSEFTLEKFGDSALPYLHRYLEDVRQGRVKVKGLTESARTAFLGHAVAPEQRQAMIREAAYFRAQQRGFIGGSPEEDWRAAEAQVEEQLAREAGLIARGRKALDSVSATAEKEFGNLKGAITGWLEQHHLHH